MLRRFVVVKAVAAEEWPWEGACDCDAIVIVSFSCSGIVVFVLALVCSLYNIGDDIMHIQV